MMTKLDRIYQQMWDDSIHNIAKNTVELDTLINSASDLRRGVTVLAYIGQDIPPALNAFLLALKTCEPEQYYYPRSDLHITVLSVISCVTGFTLKDICVPAYITAFKQALSQVKHFSIDLRGITVAPAGIVLKGYPCNESLQQLRAQLRASFEQANIYTTIDARYKLETAHSTLMRFQRHFQQTDKMVKLLKQYQEVPFGRITINNVDLVFNNWYQQIEKTQKIADTTLCR